jgi:hypothetical protein
MLASQYSEDNMKKCIELIKNGKFENERGETSKMSIQFVNAFRKSIKESLGYGLDNMDIRAGHYYMSGFFQLTDKRIFYVSCSDIRFFPFDNILIRTAKDFKDYTGGSNNYILTNDFSNGLRRYLGISL